MTESIKYYEEQGLKYMGQYEDKKAAAFLNRASDLGSIKARQCLRYLNMGLTESDFDEAGTSALEEEFDYDLQPLRHVSRVSSYLNEAIRKLENMIGYFSDSIVSAADAVIAALGGQISRV